MKLRTGILIQLGILAASLLVSVIYYFRLPEIVPTHWGLHGQVDQYGSRLTSVLLGPAMVGMMLLLTLVLPKISPRNFEIDRFSGVFAYSMVLVSVLMFFLSIVILRATEGAKFDMEKFIMAGLFLFFALLGNVLGKVRRNFFMGIRTPWTLASERVWDATHRFAGRIWLVGGLIGVGASLLGLSILGSIALLMFLGLWPVVQSYFLYRKLEPAE